MNQIKQGFCTIIAKNYLAFARTLARSLKQQHPDLPLFVLVIDNPKDYFEPSQENFTYISLDTLNIIHLHSFTFKYNITELSTAVKPFLLEFLLKKYQLDKIVYLDPDIYVYQPLNKIFQLLDTKSIILTPHLTKSLPDDGWLVDDKHILISGAYNLGFIAITNNSNTESFLKWWQNKLYDLCIIDIPNGIFVDQKWIDLVPSLFDGVYIFKELGYNVAYWNLHERNLQKNNEIWYCDRDLLYFFHFSGIILNDLDAISKHQNRYSLINRPELKPLFENYKEILIKNKHLEVSQWSYGYGYYTDKTPIRDLDRRWYYKLGFNRHQKFPNPFEVSIKTSFRSQIWKQVPILKLKNQIHSILPTYLISTLKAWIRGMSRKISSKEQSI